MQLVKSVVPHKCVNHELVQVMLVARDGKGASADVPMGNEKNKVFHNRPFT